MIPFSSFHQYAREDSIWAEKYTTPIDAYKKGFDHKNLEFIKPFSFVNCENSKIIENTFQLARNQKIHKPEMYGDNWNDELEIDDIEKIKKYFHRLELLIERVGFINFRVGKKDNYINLNKSIKKGVTFEVPRNSLMKAIRWEIFDDLLIGNFMKRHFMDQRLTICTILSLTQ